MQAAAQIEAADLKAAREKWRRLALPDLTPAEIHLYDEQTEIIIAGGDACLDPRCAADLQTKGNDD